MSLRDSITALSKRVQRPCEKKFKVILVRVSNNTKPGLININIKISGLMVDLPED